MNDVSTYQQQPGGESACEYEAGGMFAVIFVVIVIGLVVGIIKHN